MHVCLHHFLIIAYAGFSSMINLLGTTRLYAPHVHVQYYLFVFLHTFILATLFYIMQLSVPYYDNLFI